MPAHCCAALPDSRSRAHDAQPLLWRPAPAAAWRSARFSAEAPRRGCRRLLKHVQRIGAAQMPCCRERMPAQRGETVWAEGEAHDRAMALGLLQ